MMRYITLAFIGGGFMIAGACNIDHSGKNKDDSDASASADAEAQELLLQSQGEICGTHLAIAEPISAKNGEDASITVEMAYAICGSIDPEGQHSWKAIAMNAITSSVHLQDPGSQIPEVTEESKATLHINGDKEIIAMRNNGTSVRLGRVEEGYEGEIIELDEGVSLSMTIRGEPYQLGKFTKETPESDKLVWVSVN